MPTPLSRLALALLGLFALALAGCQEAPRTIEPGTYRLTLTDFPGGGLPASLEIGETGGEPAAWLINGGNRIAVEATTIAGNRLTLDFPSYDSKLEVTLQPDGSLAGTAHLRRKTGPVDLKLVAVPGTFWRFHEDPAEPAADLTGNWIVETQGEKPERGLMLLKQSGNRLEGTVQYPTGDYRFLEGDVSGAQMALSTFDGNQGSVWKAVRRADGSLAGETWGATSKEPERWTARPQRAGDTVTAIGEEKPPVDRIAFAFPDANGQTVSLADARFRGKVVVVAIGGTWCPNCHDEAQFLAPYVKRRRAEGLEVIGLQFEYGGDPARAARQSQRFARRYGIDYPLLIAGSNTPESTKAALPALGGVKIYPTTLFIDRKGKLRAIHTGYSGPATGELNRRAIAEFDRLVSQLLAEKA